MSSQWEEILAARERAHAKHGINSIENLPASDPRWLTILVGEIGEIANALTYDGPREKLSDELLDGLAVLSAWKDAQDGIRRLAT